MQTEKERVALTSIAASGGLTLAKGVVGLLTGSLAGLYPAWLASKAPIAVTLRAEAT